MAIQWQLRKGTTAQHTTFTGAVAEVTVDTDKNTLVVHDGTTAGGHALAKESAVTTHVMDTDNPHGVTKAQVGLGNVDNTSDADKPISTAAQDALDLKADADNAVLTGVPTAPTAVVGTSTTQIATTEFVVAEIDAALELQNEASEIAVTAVGNLASTNVQDGLEELQGDVDTINESIGNVNITRADKYLAAQDIVNMIYTDGNLTKIRYNNDTDVDYEVLTYTSEKLSNVAHYTSAVLRGNTVLSYADGKLVSAIYTGV